MVIIDRREARNIHEELDELLKKWSETKEYSCGVTKLRYNSSGITVTVQLNANSDGDFEKDQFERNCRSFDLLPEDYKATFTCRDRAYELVGINPRSYKYPFIGENTLGTRYKFGNRILDQIKEQRKEAVNEG